MLRYDELENLYIKKMRLMRPQLRCGESKYLDICDHNCDCEMLFKIMASSKDMDIRFFGYGSINIALYKEKESKNVNINTVKMSP